MKKSLYLFVVLVTFTVTLYAQTPQVKIPLTVSDGVTSQILNFGLDPLATDGIDASLGEQSLPPLPPTGIFETRLLLPTNPQIGSISDFRNTNIDTTILWTVYIQPGPSGYPINLSWDISSLFQGNYILKDAITGSIVNVDMKKQNTYSLTIPGINKLNIEYTQKISINYNITKGWNLISVPVLAQDMKYNVLFDSTSSWAYHYYNNNYSSSLLLFRGRGYWIKFKNNQSPVISGIALDDSTIKLNTGWNLIGPYEKPLLLSKLSSTPAGIVSSSFFGYSNGYNTPDTLKPGDGYWVRANNDGYLNINNSSLNKLSGHISLNKINKKWGKIFIEDNSGNKVVLYLGNSIGNINRYEMPPKPPESAFDVRFSSNKYVDTWSKNGNRIEINSQNYPIKIRLNNIGNVRIFDSITGGKIFNQILKDGQEISIENKELNNITLKKIKIPFTFNLGQNFPNPFNPQTSIRYTVPQKSSVKLTIYDALGKKVIELVNAVQEAGNYQILWNASRFTSGVYFYKIEAGKYIDIKKMILIK